MGRGRGTRAGAGQGAALGRLCLEERDSAEAGRVHAQLSLAALWAGSAALGLLTVLSHPFSLPRSELCAAPSLSLTQPPPLSHILCSISLCLMQSAPLTKKPPNQGCEKQIGVSLCPLLATIRVCYLRGLLPSSVAAVFLPEELKYSNQKYLSMVLLFLSVLKVPHSDC